MRCSRHNGRSGAHGAYNPKHNDREFELEKAEELKRELTRNNLYWNCIDREVVRHDQRGEGDHTFTEIEKGFYDLVYNAYIEGQNARNEAARHSERNRTADDLRENPKTCPEETIYQIGNLDKHVDYEVLAKVTFEFFNLLQEKYGSHMHILDWALHLDEGTPHIHERHVFDVINKYGERQPKQEEALKELGFELPNPEKKPGKYNNRKMSFDAECRNLFLETCKKYGLEIEGNPIYGGKKYLEKQDYIIEKLNAKVENLYQTIDTWEEIGKELQAENDRLVEENKKLELKLDDVEGLLKEVSDIAYDKACDTLIDDITDKVREEDDATIEYHKNWLMSGDRKAPKNVREYAVKQLDNLQNNLKDLRDKVVNAVRKAFHLPERKAAFIEQIIVKAKPSTLELISKYKAQIKEDDAKKPRLQKQNRGEVSR
ncbi:hypothetical protein [Butyrivibrio sp. YAB3001]|uniref:hypothetical protein n=1 Tax=Butyrivibrio sp. YAB3001 TaxID=1520812 RepID=UPI0008F67E79|nr:hypothetical protein [Butyrivibrio sp. YAB3001]SFC12239.1 hypothetical protein SAMN02910398_01571 [Butyrivibrio sp. YAB3001]